MNLNAEPQDPHLVKELLRLAHRREAEGRTAFELTKGKGMLEFVSMYRNVGLDLRVFLTALPDRDLRFAFALWMAGHDASPEQPAFSSLEFTECDDWRQDVINKIAGSVDLVRYLTDGANRLTPEYSEAGYPFSFHQEEHPV